MFLSRLLTTAAAMAMAAGAAAAQAPGPAAGQAPAAAAAPAPAAAAPAAPAPTATATAAARVVPNGDLIETARASGQFKTFVKAVDATNLTTVLKTNKNLTVFAPTDTAFAALPPGELDRLMADKPRLQKLLTYHIVNAKVDSSKIRGARGPVPTVAGTPVELDGSGDQLKANDADIVQADVMASNGVLHVIDKVLTPGAAMSATSSSSSASTTAGAAPPSGPPAGGAAGSSAGTSADAAR